MKTPVSYLDVFHTVAADAFENARNLCDRYYMNSPDLLLEEFNGNQKEAR